MLRHPPRRIFARGNTWKMRCLDEELHHAMALHRRILDSANRVQFLSLLLHRAFLRFTEYYTPTDALIVYRILIENYLR